LPNFVPFITLIRFLVSKEEEEKRRKTGGNNLATLACPKG
jgi:hypothetical protein